MANWLRLPSGRLANLDLFADIDHDVTGQQPWARATLAAGGPATSDGMIDTVAVALHYSGADAAALIRHFAHQEVVRDAPLATPKSARVAMPSVPPEVCYVCGQASPTLYGLDLPAPEGMDEEVTVGICPACERERLAEIEREKAAR